jgi:hypothetical protein
VYRKTLYLLEVRPIDEVFGSVEFSEGPMYICISAAIVHISFAFATTPKIIISSCYVEVGSTGNVSIVVLNAENIAGGSMNMTFNSSVTNVVYVIPGDFGVPVANIRNNESTVSLACALASAVGKPNATLAVLSCIGISQGITFFHVENAGLNDEQGNLVTPEAVDHGDFGVIPEFQPIGILLICLLLSSITVIKKKKLPENMSTLPKIQKR